MRLPERQRLDITLPIEDLSRRNALFGTADRNLRLIRTAFNVRISARNNTIRISGPADAVNKAAHVIESLQCCCAADPTSPMR